LLRAVATGPDAALRALAASALADRAPKVAEELLPETLSDRATLDRLVRGVPDAKSRPVLRGAALQAHAQGIALPHLSARGDVDGLAAVATDAAQDLGVRAGGLEALARIASAAAQDTIALVGKSTDDEELQKTAWRALRRAQRPRGGGPMSAPKTSSSTPQPQTANPAGATPASADAATADPKRTAFAQRYGGQSTLAGDGDRLALFADLDRDPVKAEAVLFEVFSKEEGNYAQLTVDSKALEFDGEPTYGTTNIDFSKTLFDGVQRMRSYRETRLSIGRDAVALETDDAEVLEKRIEVPDAWLRGFLQVQSAATLTETSFSLAPVDL
jgi:hypothetical protein